MYEAIFTAWGNESFSNELRDIVTSMGLEVLYGTPGDFLFLHFVLDFSMRIHLMEIENL